MSLEATILENAARRRGSVPRDAYLYDLVFVLNINSRGWILEKVCKVIEQYSGLHCGWVYSERNDRLTEDLPQAHGYFFAHYQIACHVLAKHPFVWSARRFVYFTHPDFSRGISPNELIACLNNMDHVFCMNGGHKDLLGTLGVDDKRVSVAVGGADPHIFDLPKKSGNKIGLIGAFYKRKRPDLVFELVRDTPSEQFVLIAPSPAEIINDGMSWKNFKHFHDMMALRNFEYIEAKYEDYPKIYQQFKAFVSLSELEGGPISLLETMLCGIYPIVTNTGFAEDVISDSSLGLVLPKQFTSGDVSKALANIYDDRLSRRKAALAYSWEGFATLVANKMQLSLTSGQVIAFTKTSPLSGLISGWYEPDLHGVWSKDLFSSIHFPLAQELLNEPLNIRLWLWTLPGIKKTVELSSSTNQKMEVELDGNKPVSSLLTIPSTATSRGYLNIEFKSDGLASPSELAINEDQRKLGFKLGSLAVDIST